MGIEDIFSDNIKQVNHSIGKFIKVNLAEDRQESGHIYVIDPISQTLVLIVKEAKKPKFIIIPKHVILDVTETDEPVCNDLLLVDHQKNVENFDELKRKKSLVKAWFEKRKVFLEEDGLNLVLGSNVTIEPPYTVENILVHSTVAFENMKRIFDEMPTDFQA